MKSIKGGQHPGKKNETDEMLKLIAGVFKGATSKPKADTSRISYSDLLLQLIKPYQSNDSASPGELEYLLDLGVIAWNLDIYKSKGDFLYRAYSSSIKNSGAMDKASEKLLKKLVTDKEKLFGQYKDVLLEDFEISEDKEGNTMINVISKPFDSYLQESIESAFENDLFETPDASENLADSEEFPSYVLPVINRDVIMIKPKPPFMDWLRKISFPEPPPQPGFEFTMYLLPEHETEKEGLNYIKKNFDRIFCSELWGWSMDEKTWPAGRTYKMFTQWFEVKMQCMVYDMADYPLQRG